MFEMNQLNVEINHQSNITDELLYSTGFTDGCSCQVICESPKGAARNSEAFKDSHMSWFTFSSFSCLIFICAFNRNNKKQAQNVLDCNLQCKVCVHFQFCQLLNSRLFLSTASFLIQVSYSRAPQHCTTTYTKKYTECTYT